MPGRARTLALLLLGLVAAHPASPRGPTATATTRTRTTCPRGPIRSPTRSPRSPRSRRSCERVRGYLDAELADPGRGRSRPAREITDFSVPNADARIPDGDGEAFYPLDYTMGVTHSGMLLAPRGDRATRASRSTRAGSCSSSPTACPYFREVVAKGARPGKETFGAIIRTGSLDDSGSMCAALVKARRAGVGPDLEGRHRPLERLHRPRAVPARGRDARPPAPAARVAVGRRPLHERARARPDGGAHRATGPGSTTR